VSVSLCANRVRNLFQGTHLVLYAQDPDQARAFFQNVLGLESVDAGRGWLIFALPPAELACHPAETGGSAELYLMCTELENTCVELEEAGVEFAAPVTDQGWGLVTRIRVPGFGELGLYEPRHPSPLSGFQ
jgi:catechol 2,3-dioxygenase-like lactoylglutathione lyase family enzyme